MIEDDERLIDSYDAQILDLMKTVTLSRNTFALSRQILEGIAWRTAERDRLKRWVGVREREILESEARRRKWPYSNYVRGWRGGKDEAQNPQRTPSQNGL